MNRAPTEAELQARELVEQSRDQDWSGRSFVKELFLGNFRFDWIQPFPSSPDRPEFLEWLGRVHRFMDENVDPVEIDATGEYPQHVLDGLRELGAFGMKIPKEYGGLGFTQVEYGRVMELMGRYDSNLLALLSAHQSIGVPQPVKLFGSDELKKRILPRCAAGAISAFALTEPDVGSDPGKLTTSAVKNENGDYVLNGTKLWCTNATIAELMVVMARDPETKKISAFVVETSSPGFRVAHRCRFMGLKALANGLLEFNDVVVPKENLIGKEGQGLKIALTTLNAGRLSIPSGVTAGAREMLRICREFSTERVQWGVPVGKHEAVAHKLAYVATHTWAMESMSRLANELADRKGYDIRLEAASAKEWCTTRHWEIVDTAMQVRGGRGYETEASLKARGDKPEPVERMMRDSRINRIFEGSSEIMHLFMAREALDKHLQVAGALVKAKATLGEKLAALPGMLLFYAWWYPKLWIGLSWFKYRGEGKLGGHLRFADRATRRLARNVFHGMVRWQAGMERKQAFVFRAVDVAIELFAMGAAIARARSMQEAKDPRAAEAVELADAFARGARRRINRWFREMWANDDDRDSALGRSLLDEKHAWLESGPIR